MPSPRLPSPAGTACSSAEPALARGSLAIRRLGRNESELLADHLRRLDPESRRLRFGNPVNDAFLRRYAGLALESDALVHGCFIDGVLRAVAELRFLSGAREDAEAAFSVEPAFQNHGLGDTLFGILIEAARTGGVRRLFLTCLKENRRMQKIAAHHGAALSYGAGDVYAEIRQPAGGGSGGRAGAPDAEGSPYVFGLLDWRRSAGKRLLDWLMPEPSETVRQPSAT